MAQNLSGRRFQAVSPAARGPRPAPHPPRSRPGLPYRREILHLLR
jgi:hypothetical protein